jgi:predicted SprT family Zn-dependent metalloprotease
VETNQSCVKEAGSYTAAIILPRCHLCGEVPEKGIRGVIKIGKVFICEKCEKQIVSIPVGSTKYSHLLKGLKKIWQSKK